VVRARALEGSHSLGMLESNRGAAVERRCPLDTKKGLLGCVLQVQYRTGPYTAGSLGGAEGD
jgi:hypothetical protein